MLLQEKLMILRNIRRMSVAEAAAAISVSEEEMAAYEKGTKEPAPEALFALATLFEVSTDTLLKNDVNLTVVRESIAADTTSKTPIQHYKPKKEISDMDTETGYRSKPGAEDEFVAYEYINVTVKTNDEPLYTDCYKSFGWKKEHRQDSVFGGEAALRFKRDRRLKNKQELSGLQRQCESALEQIKTLEKDKTSFATMIAVIIGVVGTALMAGSVFCFMAEIIWAVIVLGAAGFALWAIPYFIYNKIKAKKTKQSNELIEKQYEILYKACEQANKMLTI